jgi:hypothetical protein
MNMAASDWGFDFDIRSQNEFLSDVFLLYPMVEMGAKKKLKAECL